MSLVCGLQPLEVVGHAPPMPATVSWRRYDQATARLTARFAGLYEAKQFEFVH